MAYLIVLYNSILKYAIFKVILKNYYFANKKKYVR